MGAEVKRAQNSRWYFFAVVGIVALATALRFYGLEWGLPNALHSYSYHPDEFLLIGASSRVFGGSLPGFYNYPSLYIYLSALAMRVGTGYGVTSDLASIYLCARVVTVLMGVAAVGVTYWAGRVLFGKTEGLIAALVLCIAPLHVQHSHFATVDVPSTLFVAAALGFSGLIYKRGSWRDYLLGGVMVGLAAGTKYNAAVVVCSLVAAHFLRTGLKRGIIDGKLWASFGCAALAFVASTPAIILSMGDVINGITYELRHSAAGHGLVFAGTGNGFIYTFMSSLWYGLGPFLAVWFLVAVAGSLIIRDKKLLVIFAFVVPYYAMISLSHVRFARYMLPMYPAIAILCAFVIQHLYTWLADRNRTGLRLIFVCICTLIMLVTLGYISILDMEFRRPDPRDLAMQCVTEKIRAGGSIGMMDVPWFYSPPYSRVVGFGALPQRQEAAARTPYNLVIFSESTSQGDWVRHMPELVVLSDYETMDAQRLRGSKSVSGEDRRQVDRILADLRLVDKYYQYRMSFGGWCGVLGQDLPHDMRYVSPAISVYERKK